MSDFCHRRTSVLRILSSADSSLSSVANPRIPVCRHAGEICQPHGYVTCTIPLAPEINIADRFKAWRTFNTVDLVDRHEADQSIPLRRSVPRRC